MIPLNSHRRARPDLLQGAVAPLLAGGLVSPTVPRKAAGVEAQAFPLLQLLLRRLLDAIVEAGDAHLAGIVVHVGDDVGEHADGVGGGPP